jgi:pimeloyl-ACP methyl ester carboxylesterase
VRAETFRIEIPDAVLETLRERLTQRRSAPDFANDDWIYGTNSEYLNELVEYWIDGYDWRTHEAAMNAYANYRVSIDGIPIHFIHEPGVGPDPMPLILTHGWPWTFWDYEKMIRPLADPAAHGGDAADAFDVVVPSLPGFGFSSPLETPGIGWLRTAELWVRLMRDVLAFERFAAQGGDWGGIVTTELGHRFAEHMIGIHTTLPGHPALVAGLSAADYGPGEESWAEDQQRRLLTATSHMAVHTTDPQTLAYALNDSPLGLAAWIVERRRAWSDCDGDVERRFSKDDLLTTVSIYWFTQTIGTSMRFYKESMVMQQWNLAHTRTPAVEAPTGIAVFPKELIILPRRAAERNANLAHWSLMHAGGHFAPAEEPKALIDDVRACFRKLR